MKRLTPIFLALILTLPAQAIEQDKKLHLGVSVVMGTGFQYYIEDWKTSMAACSLVGLGKEIVDPYIGGTRDKKVRNSNSFIDKH